MDGKNGTNEGLHELSKEELMEIINQLQTESTEYREDIETTVTYIARLLTDLGLLSPDLKFQFSMKQLTRNVLPIITNPSSAEKKFAYLADLRGIVEKYGSTIKK